MLMKSFPHGTGADDKLSRYLARPDYLGRDTTGKISTPVHLAGKRALMSSATFSIGAKVVRGPMIRPGLGTIFQRADNGLSSQAGPWMNGRNNMACAWSTAVPGNRRTTVSWKVATAGCGMNV